MKLLALTLLICHEAISTDRRIHYGNSVNTVIPYVIALIEDPGEISWTAKVGQWFGRKEDYYQLICAGTLFATHWVVTAAHCIE